MKIILIGHKKRQGKDTVAQMMAQRHGNAKILRFADPLKYIAADMLGVSVQTLEQMKNESEIFRKVLQRLGNGAMKDIYGKDVWKELLLKKAKDLENKGIGLLIVPDFRFPNEYIEGALTVKVVGLTRADDDDISETALDGWNFDYIIRNGASLADLQMQVDNVLRHIGECA